MLQRLHRNLLIYIKGNLGIYTLITTFFCAGIIAGALLLRFLGEEQLVELNTALTYFFESLKNETFTSLQPRALLSASYYKNVLFLLVVWLLGLFWFGFPLILFYLMFKGFALGFTVAFLMRHIALKGVIFGLAALLPHNLFFVPAFIAAATTATTFSLLKLNDRLTKRRTGRSHYLQQYCYFMFLVLILMLAGGLVEAYITPMFMQLAVSVI